MTIDKMTKLVTYAAHLKDRLSNTAIPEKHKNREVQFKQFLNRKLEAVNRQIEAIKYDSPKTGK